MPFRPPSPLRLSLIAIVLAALATALSVYRYAHNRLAAIAYAEGAGGVVTYVPLSKSRPQWLPAPLWLQTVDSIEFVGPATVDMRKTVPLREAKTIRLSEDVLDDGFEALCTFPNLEWVNLGCTLTDARADILRKCPQIKGLSLWSGSITDEDLRKLPGLPVRMIIAKRSAVTDAGLKHLVGLPVDFLVLDDTPIGDEGLRNLAGAPVEFLSLGGTKVTDAGLVELAKLPKLRRLYLDHTAITDAGIQNLAGLTLEALALAHTRVSDEALPEISKLPLRSLGIGDTAISRDGMRTFRSMVALKTLHLTDPPFTVDDARELRGRGVSVWLAPPKP